MSDDHTTCQSSDGPVRFYYAHPPNHGQVMDDHVYVSCPHHGLDPLPNDGRWQIVSVHPLTITPSVHWTDCGCHGYITDGKWRVTSMSEWEVVSPEGVVQAAYPSKASADVTCDRMPPGHYIRNLAGGTR